MKPFEFKNGDGDARDAMLDSRGGRSTWEPKAYVTALNGYCKRFGLRRTAEMLNKCTGFSEPEKVPVYLRGVIIAHIAWEITERPWRVAVINQARREHPAGEAESPRA